MFLSPNPVRGALIGLAAAALFGLSAPLAKLLLLDCSPLILAGLFYLGSGGALSVFRALSPAHDEAGLRREDVPALLGVVVLGGMLGPVLMLWGLARVSAVTGSLLLNLEAPFTMLLAVLLFKEHMGRRALLAAVCILMGAGLLRLEPSTVAGSALGALAIAGACLAWAFDNNLTQRLTLRDPFAVVRIKALAAGASNLCLGLLAGHALPSWRVLPAALLIGAFSYGLSVVLDAYALRLHGAAREAAYFATAPFIGALASLLVFREPLHALQVAAMLLMLLGVVAMLRERHGHVHTHSPLRHEHAHSHDAHHQHAHGPSDPPGEPHSHVHQHATLVHDHAHLPDLHHRHEH